MNSGKNFIGGEWRDSDRTFITLNPSDTNEIVGSYAQASCAEVEQAFAAARAAQANWRSSAACDFFTESKTTYINHGVIEEQSHHMRGFNQQLHMPSEVKP